MNELIIQSEGAVRYITLNRPEKRNALNPRLVKALRNELAAAGSDPQARAIVLQGAGADFCSGADLSSLQAIAEGTIIDNLSDAEELMSLFSLIRRIEVPVIAAVRGRALAGGCGLATACDIVLASGTARFGYPEVKIGFVPAMVMAILRRNVSEKVAFELITKGFEFTAERAREYGLVNHVFADSDFEVEVAAYASDFEHVSRSAVALSKKLLYQQDGMSFDTALQTGAEVNAIARMTEDCRKGIARFLNK